MRFGISTHLYHDRPLAPEHLKELAEFGFREVELFATIGHFDYHDQAADRCARRLAARRGAPPALGSRPDRRAPLAREVGRGALHGVLGRPGARARRDGVPGGASDRPDDPVPLPGRPPRRPGRPRSAGRSQRPPGRTAQRRGTRRSRAAARRPDGRRGDPEHAVGAPTALVRLVEDELELPPPGVGICLDTGHAFLQGDLPDAIETVGGELVTTHVHDNRGKGDDHLVPFDGTIDWPTALMSFQKVGYDGVIMFELDNTSTARGRSLEKTVDVRRRFERDRPACMKIGFVSLGCPKNLVDSEVMLGLAAAGRPHADRRRRRRGRPRRQHLLVHRVGPAGIDRRDPRDGRAQDAAAGAGGSS